MITAVPDAICFVTSRKEVGNLKEKKNPDPMKALKRSGIIAFFWHGLEKVENFGFGESREKL